MSWSIKDKNKQTDHDRCCDMFIIMNFICFFKDISLIEHRFINLPKQKINQLNMTK